MTDIDGGKLRQWRRSRRWDVPTLARELRRAAGDDPVPVHDALVRMIRRWEREGLRTERYELLYRSLGFSKDVAIAAVQPAPPRDAELAGEAGDARDVMAWIAGSNTTDDEIGELARAVDYLASAHTRLAAGKVLPEVLKVHKAAKTLLRGGRQRLSQTRELVRIDAELLAHASLLLGDLGKYGAAREYANAALMCAQEAGVDEGIVWSVMAKTARWEARFTEAAGLALRGLEVSARAPVRVELAYREANASALFGDTQRALAALHRADSEAEGLEESSLSAWSFPRGRQAIFALNVCMHTGDPDAALRAADAAEAYWDAGGTRVTATWAQIRAGAAMAYLLKDSLDGAVEQLTPVLDLPPDQRIRTVTGYLAKAGDMLEDRRFTDSSAGAALRERITDFISAAPGGA